MPTPVPNGPTFLATLEHAIPPTGLVPSLGPIPGLPLSLLPGNMPNDALGVFLGLVGGGKPRLGPDGNLIFENVRGPVAEGIRFINNNTKRPIALTLGHVILSTDPFQENTEYGAKWLAHESAHVRQYEALGPAFLPLYLGLWLVSGRQHDAHPFEQWADEYRDAHWPEYAR